MAQSCLSAAGINRCAKAAYSTLLQGKLRPRHSSCYSAVSPSKCPPSATVTTTHVCDNLGFDFVVLLLSGFPPVLQVLVRVWGGVSAHRRRAAVASWRWGTEGRRQTTLVEDAKARVSASESRKMGELLMGY